RHHLVYDEAFEYHHAHENSEAIPADPDSSGPCSIDGPHPSPRRAEGDTDAASALRRQSRHPQLRRVRRGRPLPPLPPPTRKQRPPAVSPPGLFPPAKSPRMSRESRRAPRPAVSSSRP